MKKALILALFAAAPVLIFSQKPIYRVLAENGLKLRESPGMGGKVLAVAPFWREVEVLAELKFVGWDPDFVGNFKTDTVGIGFVRNHPKDIQKKDTVLNIGQWLPVKFKGKNGFMFGSFLGPIWGPRTERLELEENYRLRNSGWGYSNDPEIDSTWVWHGLFKIKNGFETRPVKLLYLNHSNRIEILTDDPVQPIYKFGSKEKWPRQKLQNLKDRLPISTNLYSKNVGKLPQYHDFGLHYSKTGMRGLALKWAVICPDGQYQWLEVENDGHYNQINWIGDLDGDGRLDYIFELNGIGGYEDLYLSSTARDGDAVRLVARLWYFGC